MLENIFGLNSAPMKKYMRMRYWMPKVLFIYRVTRMVVEKIMLTSNSKFRLRPG